MNTVGIPELPLEVPDRLNLHAWFARAEGAYPDVTEARDWLEQTAADVAADVDVQEVWLYWGDQFWFHFTARLLADLDAAICVGVLDRDGMLSDVQVANAAVNLAYEAADAILSAAFTPYLEAAEAA